MNTNKTPVIHSNQQDLTLFEEGVSYFWHTRSYVPTNLWPNHLFPYPSDSQGKFCYSPPRTLSLCSHEDHKIFLRGFDFAKRELLNHMKSLGLAVDSEDSPIKPSLPTNSNNTLSDIIL